MFKLLRLSYGLARAAPALKIDLQRLQCYASFTLRDILQHDTSNEAGSLLTHFAKHIALERVNCQDLVSTTVRYSDYFPVTDMRYFQKELRRTAIDQVPAVILFAFTYRPSADPSKFASILNELDAHCCSQLPQMSTDCVLNTLYAFLYLLPHWLSRLDFYYAAVNRLATQDFKAHASKQFFVQLCFYLGLGRKYAGFGKQQQQQQQTTNTQLLQKLNQYVDFYLPNLSSMDLALVCDANFKNSTSISSKLLPPRLEQEINNLQLDASNAQIFVTLIKYMRFQRLHFDSNCTRLSQLLQDNLTLKQLPARALMHLYAFFAENRWPANEFQETLAAEFLQRLQGRGHVEIRGKDIATFLWCCAQLNCSLTQAQMQQIEHVVLQKIRQHELRQYADVIVDTCLYLWMLGYKSRSLLEEAVIAKTQPNQRSMRDNKQLLDNKITALLMAVSIEQNAFLKSIEGAIKVPTCDFESLAPAYLLKDRPDMLEYEQRLQNEADIAKVKIICPIKGINIPIFAVEFKEPISSTVLVSLLTAEQMLRNSQLPIAIVRLQIRLLEALKYNVAVLEPDDLLNNYNSLKELLFTETADDSNTQKQKTVSSI